MNRNRKNNNFKKDINRDVTQTDQKEASNDKKADYRKTKKSNKGNAGNRNRSREGKYTYDTNNIAWYAKLPKLLQSAANIQFINWYGDLLPDEFSNQINLESTPFLSGVGGILTMDVMPTLGHEEKPTDPVNMASEKLWSYLFHTVSGQTFADAPDMMMYMLSMCEVYSYIVWLEYLYGMRNNYFSENTFLPEQVVLAQGVDYSDIIDNQTEFWGGINTLINLASSLCVPKEFTLFERRAFLYQNAYIDGASVKSQIYQFKPAGFYTFMTEASTGTPIVKFNKFNDLWTAKPKVSELITFGKNMINALLANQDIKKLSSLTLRAYGTEGIIKLNEMELNYRTPLVYSLEVLEQFKNATVLSLTGLDDTTFDITQNMSLNCLNYQLKTLNPGAASLSQNQINKAWTNIYLLSRNKILTTSVANAGPEIIVENSRLMAASSSIVAITRLKPAAANVRCASEIAVGLHFTYPKWDVATDSFKWDTLTESGIHIYDINKAAGTALTVANIATAVRNIQAAESVMSDFKFCPSHRYVAMNNLQPAEIDVLGNLKVDGSKDVFDVDNYAIISSKQLIELDNVIMYNLLYSDTVAKAWNGQ